MSFLARRPSRSQFFLVVVWITSISAAFLAGAIVFRQRHQIRRLISTAIRGRILQSHLYNIAVTTIAVPGEGRDGGIDALDDGLLLANRLGAMWFVTSAREVRPLSLKIPVNFDEFDKDPYNENTDLRDQFGVKDILLQRLETGVRLLASSNHWYSDKDCYVLRVSSLETTADEIRSRHGALQPNWRTVFETTPCLPLEVLGGVHNPTKDAGGRLVARSDSEILVSVGRFGVEGGEDEATDYSGGVQNRANSYGKTILIDLVKGGSRIYTIGHRNPEGMTVAPDGTVLLTEHGPRGGDELNLAVEGRNYGWPIVSYGTQYESTMWSPSLSKSNHEGFEKPIYAWIPSIGISQLIALEGNAFEQWTGDLLVSSLAGQALFRIRLTDGRPVVVEPIPIGHRVRDLVELKNGTIALKTDDDYLVFLEPVNTAHLAAMDPGTRGKVAAARCSGCHSLEPDGTDAIGPALWGIVRRNVASRKGFAYSPALTSMGGRWTPERLRAYISNPASVAPGTRMSFIAKYDSQALDDLLAFLETLR
jgi:aldose sugar dehydrogenase